MGRNLFGSFVSPAEYIGSVRLWGMVPPLVSRGRGKSLSAALTNIFTIKNCAIALIASILGHLGFETLRKKS